MIKALIAKRLRAPTLLAPVSQPDSSLPIADVAASEARAAAALAVVADGASIEALAEARTEDAQSVPRTCPESVPRSNGRNTI